MGIADPWNPRAEDLKGVPPSGAFGQNRSDSSDLRSRIQKAAGLPVYEAVLASGVSRLRPVSMTALTTALGHS